MNKLNVIYAGWGERWLLGTLADTGRQILFEYSAEARRQGLELSPLRAPLAHVGAIVGAPFCMGLPGFIADALPDGWGLLLMDRAFRRAGRRPEQITALERLAFIGERAIGALVFEPADDIAAEPDSLELEQLAMDAALVLANEDADEALRHLLLLGGSPQGARPKVLVNYDPASGRISCRIDPEEGEPWLIKFPAGEEHRDACAIEALYARLAEQCGLDMPESHFFALDGRHSAFGVRRFDRQDGLRVPLQSLSAALQVDYRLPTLDYEMLLRLTRRLTGDEREVAKACERCVFNVLAHNRDDHSRNFAFRLDRQRRWRLAPPFDLTFNEGPRGEHFTTIAGEGRAPGRHHLRELARRGGIPEKQAEATMDRLCEAMNALPQLAHELPIRKSRLAALRRILNDDRRRVMRD
ncbi:MAG TPA: type II toxin-antitoxin system HipA family toxin [Rhodocyclaceae bacterium]|nr:type II toxin-antitoxin system HipA family toxin [Rhodocyclaceae bacterium]